MSKRRKFTNYSLFVSCVAAIGGILFGYNTSVISGVLLFITRDFQLTTFEQELIVSTLLIGALIGSLAGGLIADSLGRKKTLFATLILFFIGVLTLTIADSFTYFLVGRFISGLAVGIVSMAVPLYIAEMSPPENRGALVSLNQLCVTIGILLAYLVSYAFAAEADWRDMFACAFIPIGIQFVGLFFIAETPSWLISHHKRADAEEVLEKIQVHHGHHPHLVNERKEEDGLTKKRFKALLAPSVRMPFLIGIGVAVFQSITGINTVIYYAPRIFQLAGFTETSTALFATVLVGTINVIVTVIALWLIDRVGRRPLLIAGLIGMAGSLFILGLSFLSQGHASGLTAIFAMLIYVGFFAVSLGPVAWLIISEVYPLGVRGRAMGIATFSNWLCNYFVSLTFLTLIQDLGTSGTFWLYAIICLLGLWFVIRLVPETKGKTLEEIQSFWKKT
ncbi:MAG: sugar porter family MFS transporter [Verrucomicrobia bacterium]|nr:sugar porter family MFS transporter [Verrucomicrobiota bacterium]MDE3046869.1 sugar porter family MFS transporter [Verrucomicrobiota bacterium]